MTATTDNSTAMAKMKEGLSYAWALAMVFEEDAGLTELEGAMEDENI